MVSPYAQSSLMELIRVRLSQTTQACSNGILHCTFVASPSFLYKICEECWQHGAQHETWQSCCRFAPGQRSDFPSCLKVLNPGCVMDYPATPASSDKGILEAHASSVSDPSLPTVLKCSENINTSSVQAVPGTRCPTSLSSMASTRGVPWSWQNLLFTNPTQALKAHPGWGPELVVNATYALFIST